jgi:lysyl endopeptidase
MKSWVIGVISLALMVIAICRMAEAQRGPPPSSLPGAKSVEAVERMVMPAVDVEALLAEDVERESAGRPLPARYAKGLPAAFTPANSGTWEVLDDGSQLWRLRIAAPGALSVSLGLKRFDLPTGATFWVHDPDGAWVQGPYTAENRNALGGLWTAVVLGDELVVELHLPARAEADLGIDLVNHGYRFFGEREADAGTKRGACNINVICPQGDPWRNQIRSVARITFTSGANSYLCTAQLVNNTAEDHTPYLLTAQHCIDAPEVAPTIVAYWNYQTSDCGNFFGGSLAENQSGAILISSYPLWSGSDFALVELDAEPDLGYNVYYSGWDARDATPASTTTIHHPGGDQKSISFDYDAPTITSYLGDWSPGDGNYLRIDDWDQGTTEGGSSGGCLFDDATGLCVGTLSGGYAACSNDDPDWYGRLARDWTGDGTPHGRLSDWLDPGNVGTLWVDGLDSDQIFADGFESGGPWEWSVIVPSLTPIPTPTSTPLSP